MFFDTAYEKKNTYNKPVFMKFTLGMHTTRILGTPMRVYIHWLAKQRLALQCLGDDCPICRNNKMIQLEHPEDYKNQPEYCSRQQRHLMNILDRTVAKICPKCQEENKAFPNGSFPTTCVNQSCGALLTSVDALPLDKVKVLGVSFTNAEALNTMSLTKLDANKNPIPLTEYDIVWGVSKGQGGRNSASPFPGDRGEVSVPADALFDLTKVTLTLTPEEINEVLKGISLKDVFLARREEGKTESSKATEETQKLVEDQISGLFGA